MTAAKTPRKTAAVAAEALADGTPFEFDGQVYTATPTSEWPLEALEAFEVGHLATALRHTLGEAQYATFRATKPRVADVGRFVEALQAAVGISGN